MGESEMRAPELARQLRVDPKQLRAAIRKHALAPDHEHRKHYRLSPEDVTRIKDHPSVRGLGQR